MTHLWPLPLVWLSATTMPAPKPPVFVTVVFERDSNSQCHDDVYPENIELSKKGKDNVLWEIENRCNAILKLRFTDKNYVALADKKPVTKCKIQPSMNNYLIGNTFFVGIGSFAYVHCVVHGNAAETHYKYRIYGTVEAAGSAAAATAGSKRSKTKSKMTPTLSHELDIGVNP